ncbi:hypothetical protein AWJ20_2235 [Sugiyamaella lignohabitans]|uniref:FAD-binding domain-containing protein n=1 Tax=Sugiyamaella lignohabitans TaxID=796027 RepID=A0A161HG41_9ASCO|nr:uncharacterized protein AWJ20_2235 [Sugiyamaella lignohabitans]ANB14630.1 hypothetical protein AWJ20_2235 [Sugiyamaella lignohabitans]
MVSVKNKFKIIVCGGGLGGLGCAIGLALNGHHVIVLEAASEINEVGAGIQIPPNCVKVLNEYGVAEKLKKYVTKPANINLRRYSTGEILNATKLDPHMTETYGFPYWLIHRADYQRVLWDYALSIGVAIKTCSRIDSVDDATHTVKLVDGTTYTGDLIVGADGIRSKVRDSAVVDEEVVLPTPSSNCAYRATVPAEEMLADPVIAHLMTDINSNCWIGYRRHVMAYPIRNGKMYNIVMSHPGQAAVGKWAEPGDIEEMKNHYKNFDPVVVQLLTHVKTVLKWVLADLPTLPRWVSKSGQTVLIGDAAHAMLPYLAQGAAQAIEDGACISSLLSQCETEKDIPDAMRKYEKRRKLRCEKIQRGARDNGYIWHMPDGEEQEQRDSDMKLQPADKKNPNQWSDPLFQKWMFGWDAFRD